MKSLSNTIKLFLLLFILNSNAWAAMPPISNQAGKTPSFANMLSKVMPAVVNITVLGKLAVPARNFGSSGDIPSDNLPPPQEGSKYQDIEDMGSGVIVDANHGYILTNAHVVRGAKIILVTLNDGRRLKAKLIGLDKLSDIAVLQIKANKLVALPLANSENLQVGDFVAAIGNPFGLHETVTSGVVSALHRSDLGIEGYENFIQTDAPINPGNSGGALINMNGELVGINTAILGSLTGGSIGIGFAIPSNMARAVMEQLIQHGEVKRGVLGVFVQDLTPSLADAFNISGSTGGIVTNVMPGSPADKAGIKAEDVIEKINGIDMKSGPQVKNTIGLLPIDTKVNLQIRRHNQVLNISATIVDPKTLKADIQPVLASLLDGVRLVDYDELVPNLGPIKGVGVVDVDIASEAFLGGLRPGDVILAANGKTVANIDQLMQTISNNPHRLLLKVGRDDGIIFLVIE